MCSSSQSEVSRGGVSLLSHAAVFLAGILAGVGILLVAGSAFDSESKSAAIACTFPAYDGDAAARAPDVKGGFGAEQPSAQARTVLAESVVELHVKVCFEDGATFETGGTGILVSSGPPWRVLTANHNIDARQWGAVHDVAIEVQRRGAFSGGVATAKVVKSDPEADIAELSLDMPDGMVWQPGTPPQQLSGPAKGTISFLCYFELEIRRGLLIQEVSRADGVPTYELGVPAGPGCSGAGAINQAGQLVGIVTQANDDVTRVSSITAFE
jgi:Trypsin-like peptidase domain